jgi:glycine/D-amino acid oxidase-like deaminating enzyme
MNPPRARHESLWLADPPPPAAAFSGRLDADVLVVGGGITGLTLAYTLAEQGVSVGLFEAGPLAGGASGRNAGFLMAAPAESYAEQVEFWGRPGARAVLETGRRTHQRIRQLIEALGIECDYRVTGSLRLTITEEEAEEHRSSLPLLRADGFPMHEVAVSDALPGPIGREFTAAFVMPEDGVLHPVRFLDGVAKAAAQKGAQIYSHSPVVGARWKAGLWNVRAGSGVASARHLVLATNAWAGELCPSLRPLIVPRRGQVLATAPLEREISSIPAYAHYGYRYWRQTPDRRLLIGGWRDTDLDGETGFGIEPTGKIQSAIEGGLAELVPEGATIEFRWAGTMGFARDGRPLVGWLDAQHHLAVCAGFTGHGMGMAAACTLDLAALLAWREAPGIATYDPARFAELRQANDGVTALGAATP